MGDLLGLSSQVAVVTGCARGIGAAVARLLCEYGSEVIGVDIDKAGGQSTMQEIAAATGRGHFRHLDLAQTSDINKTVQSIGAEWGRIDILVNNAGLTRTVNFFDLGPEDWNEIIDVNLKGTLAMMQAVARLMATQGKGAIVNVSSIAGKGYRKTSNIAYAATKGALVTITRIAAAELGQHNIRVNAICPGPTETEMMRQWITETAATRGVEVSAVRSEIYGESALGRGNDVDDVARAVLFLVSDAARTVTGQSLNIDGGIMWD